ncbi:MAG: hypothetical protein A3E84_04390 [Gammaproteobacteria bacterium RIFCSPHIGHO2_12_FULL_42_13]|nr:MAG: hypothetical protein A3E84_04390 [Gammaproteobacteria bacterium RIFCSPHIGHO2_12_FULL_42_13]
MLRICLGLLFALAAFSAQAQVIIFGDSLSDIGNLPESPNIFWDNAKPPSLSNLVPQWYVPFSNPVDTQSNDAKPGGWPILDNQLLFPQPAVNQIARKYRSMSWTQFFVDQENSGAKIVPSQRLSAISLPTTLSVNYAWGYATSDWYCVNPYYEPISPCAAKSIAKARADYVAHPESTQYQSLQIPGVASQIALFINDVRSHRVLVTTDTRYFLWIGGNDLISSTFSMLHHQNPFPFLRYLGGKTSRNIIQGITILLHHLPARQRPDKVYVLTLFNPQLTPGFHNHFFLSLLGNFAVHIANGWIRLDAATFNLFSSTKIVVLPAYDWFQKAANNRQFRPHVGETCQLHAHYTNPQKIPKTNCQGYLFWNDVHPALPMQILIAKHAVCEVIHTDCG